MLVIKKLFLCLAVAGSLVAAAFALSSKQSPEVVYRAQTKEEAFSFVIYLMKNCPWFKANGYDVSLPTHPVFDIFSQKPELITEKDERVLRQLFYEEIYDASKFTTSLETTRQTEDVVKQALQKLALLEINWGFKVKRRYDIVLTLYGPGGNYYWAGEVGVVTKKVGVRAHLQSCEKNAETIVHEIVHIGIEENIVQKYHLSHWQKERLVDLICSFYLKDILPGYRNQKMGDVSIDSFVDEKSIRENLPAAIEAFVAQHPR